jgi:hypothetical protein
MLRAAQFMLIVDVVDVARLSIRQDAPLGTTARSAIPSKCDTTMPASRERTAWRVTGSRSKPLVATDSGIVTDSTDTSDR